MQCQRRGKPLILLPQAFGPFNRSIVREDTKKLIERSEFCYVRDKISMKEVQSIVPAAKNVSHCPDFTPLVKPVSIEDEQCPTGDFVAIVPNYRMLDKTDKPEIYVDFLSTICDSLDRAGKRIIFVLHDADEDKRVVELMEEGGRKLEIYQHADPRVLKQVLGNASFVVGSRFHALVSSLSQAVPCIVAGWAHKYPELAQQFDCTELHLADLSDHKKLEDLLNVLTTEQTNKEYRQRIRAAAERTKSKIDEMWENVFEVIDNLEPNK